MSRSSRPSPFKRSISALSPASPPPQAGPQAKAPSGPQAASPAAQASAASRLAAETAPPLQPSAIASANGSTRGTAATATGRASASTSRSASASSAAVQLPDTFAGPRVHRGPGPMAFEPLKDDAVRRSRKFIGRHKGLLTGPGAWAVDAMRRRRGVFGLLLLLGLLGLGGYLGVQAWQDANSTEARERMADREEAIQDGTWPRLLAHVQRYELAEGDEELRQALEQAYRAEVDRRIAEAEAALRTGEPDTVLALPGKLDELTAAWLATVGHTLPIALGDSIEQRMAHFERQAVAVLETRLFESAQRAEQRIEAGEVEPGVAVWEQGKQAVRTLLGAFTLPTRDREHLDASMRENEASVLRAVEQRQVAALREAYETARRKVEADPMALDAFVAERTTLLERGRRWAETFGLSERALVGLERSAEQFTDDLARALRTRLGEQVDQARTQGSQALMAGGNPAQVIDGYRSATGEVLNIGRASGLFDVSRESAEFLGGRIADGEGRLREMALREAGDISTLRALHLRYESVDPPFAERVAERIRHELRRAGDYEGAAEFGDESAQIFALFDRGIRQFWADRDHSSARESFQALIAAQPAAETDTRTLNRLQALARGYLTLIEAAPGQNAAQVRQALQGPATLALDTAAASHPLEALSVGYFQMVRGNFPEARVLLRQAEPALGPGIPIRYLTTVALVRSNEAEPEVPDAALARREDSSDRDRNKLYLLRFWAHVERRGEVYDATALDGLKTLLDAGAVADLLPELNRDAHVSLSEAELRFTLGVVRYFYYAERSAGVAEMRRVTEQPYARASGLFGRVIESVFPGANSDHTTSDLQKALQDVDREATDDAGTWPMVLVRALARFHMGFELAGDAAAPHFAQASQRFERLADLKPLLGPVARTYQGRMAVMLGQWVRAETLLRRVAEEQPRFGEVYHWLGDLYASHPDISESDPEFAVDLFRRAAGLRADQPVAVPYPGARHRLFDDATLPGVDDALRRQAEQAYRGWYAEADDVARREFPRPVAPAARESDGDGEASAGADADASGRESETVPPESERGDGAFRENERVRPNRSHRIAPGREADDESF